MFSILWNMKIFIIIRRLAIRTMKSIIEVECSESSLGLMPFKNKNTRFLPIAEQAKDLNLLLSDPDPKILP